MLPHRLLLLVTGWSSVAFPTFAQSPTNAIDRDLLQPLLCFEAGVTDGKPSGWFGGPDGTVFAETKVTYQGGGSARLTRDTKSEAAFSSLTKGLPLTVSGNELELRGFLRTEEVTQPSGLWLRVDGYEGVLEFTNMQSQGLTGTTPWTSYSIKVPLNPEGQRLAFGAFLSGSGTLWADELELLVDGKPLWEAPRVTPPTTVLDRDREFVSGSRIPARAFTTGEIKNLALLGEVWGFLKYHHPRVTAGDYHWDFELFRILPAVLAARDLSTAQSVLAAWVETFGPPETPASFLEKPERIHLPSDSTWLNDESVLGSRLRQQLQSVHDARSKGTRQFYLALKPGVKNPDFTHELVYGDITFPDGGYQLLGLFRFWNIIRYWSPYRDLLEEDWHDVLREFVPRIGSAATREEYERELIALTARVYDTHTNIWGPGHQRPPHGTAYVPAILRFIEDELVVVETLEDETNPTPVSPLRRGDVIVAIDGRTVADLVLEYTPYYPASNEPTRRRDLARWMTRGPAGRVTLQVQRDNAPATEISVERIPADQYRTHVQTYGSHTRPGPAFQRLGPEVAYLKLSGASEADVLDYVQQAAGTRGWILDLRGYPAAFLVFKLGGHFVETDTLFACFTTPVPSHPGMFEFTPPIALKPRRPHYAGKRVILVDEVTQSSAEYHAMAFRAAPGSVVVGSTTAGADGNVSPFSFPGGFRTMISGIGVFYPDQRPTQRIGIVPDVVAKPTRAGILAGRDEVLEEGLRQILGATAPVEDLLRSPTGDATPPAAE